MNRDVRARSLLRSLLLMACLLCCACGAAGEAGSSVQVPDDPQAGPGETGRQTYLVVVAHPDDENQISPVRAKWAREGHQVAETKALGPPLRP